MAWIIDNIPLWVWVVLAVAALAATYPFWSMIWAFLPQWLKVLILAAAAGIGIYAAGRYRGSQDEKQRQRDSDAQAVKRRNDTNAQVSNLDPATRDREFNKWLRDK